MPEITIIAKNVKQLKLVIQWHPFFVLSLVLLEILLSLDWVARSGMRLVTAILNDLTCDDPGVPSTSSLNAIVFIPSFVVIMKAPDKVIAADRCHGTSRGCPGRSYVGGPHWTTFTSHFLPI